MHTADIYADIAKRTGGHIYLGVIGPVRTGKSTFIKRFMESLVIPNIKDDFQRERARDELPQSGSGRTVMTAEPKFVPETAASVQIGKTNLSVRLVDCVGYMVPSALGQFEDDLPRMVSTPWHDDPIPMTEAAEIGTRKVIKEHSTIGVLVTTDGSITGIPRQEYEEAEERVVAELKETGKPFIILLNTTDPKSDEAAALAESIAQKYNVTTLPVDALHMETEEIAKVMEGLLYEFPVRQADVFMPAWCDGLPNDHWLKESVFKKLAEAAANMKRVRDVGAVLEVMAQHDNVSACTTESVNLADGTVEVHVDIPRETFYKIIHEETGFEVAGDGALLPLLRNLAQTDRAYRKVRSALQEVEQKGYGIVFPDITELRLEKPELFRQGSQFGVKLQASAPSIHMMRANIETTVSPIVGSEQQSEDLVNYLLKEFEGDELRIWESNIFGKSLHELVNEGLNAKLNHMPEAARGKMRETLERIINEGSNGLICIIL